MGVFFRGIGKKKVAKSQAGNCSTLHLVVSATKLGPLVFNANSNPYLFFYIFSYVLELNSIFKKDPKQFDNDKQPEL